MRVMMLAIALTGMVGCRDSAPRASERALGCRRASDCGLEPTWRCCSGTCKNSAYDDANCGACGVVCAVDKYCNQSACICSPPKVPCGAVCADLQNDPKNCGACGTDCTKIPGGAVCNAGFCQCDPNGLDPNACRNNNMVLQYCANFSTDCAHCGGCGTNICNLSEICCGGIPTFDLTDNNNCGACGNACNPGVTCCGGGCHDLRSDVSNCGACNHPCSSGQGCCSSVCRDLTSDSGNCGACGMACGQFQTCCSSACTDTQTDPNHCGSCNTACGALQSCVHGICQ